MGELGDAYRGVRGRVHELVHGADAGAWTVLLGSGARVATLRAGRFELLRAVTGRRSAEQMRAFVWRGDLDVTTLVDDRFSVRTDPLVE